jgi:peptidoglycan/xylan/chitin deacetylase (PgdA/CDA1 family)
VNVEVDWDSGSGSAANPAPDPSPTGWYEAAFGTSPTGQGKVIYLTFDDGPAAQTADVLKLLRANDARVTFFVLGQQAAANPGMVKRIHDEGHAIGNHSWDHTDLKTLTRAEIVSQLERTQRAAAPYIGACMRPPYGAVNSKVGTTSESLGLQPIMWTAQAWDWRPPPTSKIVADMKSGTTDGAVLLLHDGGGDRTNTVDALKELLPWWKRDGYRLAAIPTCA